MSGSKAERGSQAVVVVMDRLIGAASFRYLAQAIFEDAIALQVLHNRRFINSADPGQ